MSVHVLKVILCPAHEIPSESHSQQALQHLGVSLHQD